MYDSTSLTLSLSLSLSSLYPGNQEAYETFEGVTLHSEVKCLMQVYNRSQPMLA